MVRFLRFTRVIFAAGIVFGFTGPVAANAGFLPPFPSVLDFLGDVNLVPVADEQKLSREMAAEVEKQQKIVRDRRIVGYVSDLGRRLAGALGDRSFRYRFRVVDDPAVNAFNIGGGYIYVHTGLLAAAGTEGELASVLAHEIGHQARRHVAKALSRQYLFQSMARFAFGEEASPWVRLGANLGITTGQLHFGRDAEREADEVMVDLLPRAGFDPREAIDMLERIRRIQGSDPGRVASIFSSHPPTKERIANVRREIARKGLPRNLSRDSRRFHEIQRLVAKR